MILKAIKAKNYKTTVDKPNVNVSEETLNIYVSKLQKMLRCKTVYDINNYDDTEFSKFREVVKQNFPMLNKVGELKIFGSGCIVYKVKGLTDKNIMLMSHHDVVGTDNQDWKYEPFNAEIHDGYIYARGSLDTKTPLFGEMQAVEELLTEGYNFPFNVYIASSNNEEVCGDGIVKAVEYFSENNIYFDFLIDEGGAIVDKQLPSIKGGTAMVAVHEKGRHTYKLTAQKDTLKDSGHSGLTCKSDNPIVRMSQFISEIQHFKFGLCLYNEVKATFEYACPYMSFPYRLLFSNINIFKSLLLKVMPKVSPAVGAMLSNSVTITNIKADSLTDMIQAKTVTATAFFRCIREEDLFKEVEQIKLIASKYGISVQPELRDFCEPASFTNEQYKVLEKTIHDIFPSVPVIPFLLTAGSDARRFTSICKNIYRFAPLQITSEQFKTIHQANENISVSNVGEIVCFYKKLLQNLR